MSAFSPALIIDEQKCKTNIRRMFEKCNHHNIEFRPHFKTHQSVAVGEWFRDFGIDKITVSSLKMAEYFANSGWYDIFIAFPVNVNDVERINVIAQNINLHLSVESSFVAKQLSDRIKSLLGIYIKIDTGYHRTGLESTQTEEIEHILDIINHSEKLNFSGFYTHAGHTYNAISKNEILSINRKSIEQLQSLKKRFHSKLPSAVLSSGDTPSCSIAHDFQEITELRPGNFVFYDIQQFILGSCTIDDIAVALSCPVVAKHKSRNELVIHGGAVHLSKESILYNEERIFGLVVNLTNNSWVNPVPDTFVKNLSQEHGIIKTRKQFFDSVEIGDTVGVLPVHSCLTANLMHNYVSTTGKIISKTSS